jgi:hypothetical protein
MPSRARNREPAGAGSSRTGITSVPGFEKDQVVGGLHQAGYELNGDALQRWALAHGWRGESPKRFAKYAEAIKSGKRPRTRFMPRDGYLDHLTRKPPAMRRTRMTRHKRGRDGDLPHSLGAPRAALEMAATLSSTGGA